MCSDARSVSVVVTGSSPARQRNAAPPDLIIAGLVDDLAYLAASTDPSVTEVSISGGELTVTAIARGEATVTVTATDTEGLTATQEFVVTVPNRAPLATGSIEERTIEVDETSSLELSGYFSDPDGDVLVYSAAISDAAVAGVEVSGGALAVTAIAKGTATVTVTATDIDGLTATHTFGVTVPNRPPVVAGSIEGRTIEVGEAASLDLSNHFSDPDGDVLVYTAAASDAAAASIEERTLEVVQSAVLALPGYFEDPDGDALAYAVSSLRRNADRRFGRGQRPDRDGRRQGRCRGDGHGHRHGRAHGHTDVRRDSGQSTAVGGGFDRRADHRGGRDRFDGPVELLHRPRRGWIDLQCRHFVRSGGRGRGLRRHVDGGRDCQGRCDRDGNRHGYRGPHGHAGVRRDGAEPGFRWRRVRIETRTIEVDETADLDLSSYFSDPDGDALAYTAAASDAAVADAGVEGAAMTVTAVAKGEATVTVTATDTEGLTATQMFAVTVPNRAPMSTGAMEERILEVGETAALDLSDYFSDPDGDALAYTATSSDAAVMGVEVSDGALTVTALGKGSATVTITATDTDDESVTHEWVVSAANQAPLPVGSIEVSAIEVGETAILDMSGHFTDPDGDDISYEATSSDAMVASVEVTWNSLSVAAIARGTATVTVAATDTEGMTAVQEFTVSVPNRAPLAVGTVEPMEMSEGGITRLDPSPLFADPDGDALALEAESSRPQIAKAWVASNGVLVRGVKKGTATVTITAEDSEGLATTLRFNVRVKGSGGSDPNQPPVVVGNIHTQNLEEDDSRMVDASSYFGDPDDDELEFRAGSSDPEVVEATVSGDEVDLQVTGTGTATVTVTAEDPEGLEASTAFAVAVVEASDENRAPAVVGTVAAQTLEKDGSRTLDASTYFTDPDNDDLDFSTRSSDIEVVTVAVSDDQVQLQATSLGTATVTISAEDPGGLDAEQSFVVTVVEPEHPNRAPVAGTIPVQNLVVGDSRTMDASSHFSDLDEDELTFAAESSDTEVVTATVSGEDIELQAVAGGTATVTVTAEDPEGLSVGTDFQVSVTPTDDSDNKAPTVKRVVDNRTLLVDTAHIMQPWKHFEDPDDNYDDLTFTATSSNSDIISVEVLPSTVIWSSSLESLGQATVTVTARDPDGLTAELSFVLTVGNNAPTVKKEPDDILSSPAEIDTVTMHLTFEDGDIGERLSYSASSSNTDVVAASISPSTLYGYYLRVRGVAVGDATATDLGGLEAETTVSVTVHSNRPPRLERTAPCPEGGEATLTTRVTGETTRETTIEPDGCQFTEGTLTFAVDGAPSAMMTMVLEWTGDGEVTLGVTGTLAWMLDERTGTCALDLKFADSLFADVGPALSGTLCGHEVTNLDG